MTNTLFYDGKKWTSFSAKAYYASAGQIVIGRNGPIINAHGGDCRVLLFYESFKKIGALIHIDAADIYDNSHELLIDVLLAKVTFEKDSTVFLCGDLRHSDKEMVGNSA